MLTEVGSLTKFQILRIIPRFYSRHSYWIRGIRIIPWDRWIIQRCST